jgi:hypothetical protein
MVKSQVIRKALLTAVLDPPKRTQHVEVKQIDFAPGQETGLHLHPCPRRRPILDTISNIQSDRPHSPSITEKHPFLNRAKSRQSI